MTVKISVTRALAKVSQLDDKIGRATAALTVTAVTKGQGDQRVFFTGNQKIEDFEAEAKSGYQSIIDMINLRSQLKSAIGMSNSTTKVTIGKIEMTVAEAIQRKAMVSTWEHLISTLRTNKVKTDTLLKRESDTYEKKEEDTLSAYGSRDKAPKAEELDIILKPLRDKQKPGVSDVLDVSKLCAKLQEELDEFVLEVDFVLSESNASTMIEV